MAVTFITSTMLTEVTAKKMLVLKMTLVNDTILVLDNTQKNFDLILSLIYKNRLEMDRSNIYSLQLRGAASLWN